MKMCLRTIEINSESGEGVVKFTKSYDIEKPTKTGFMENILRLVYYEYSEFM